MPGCLLSGSISSQLQRGSMRAELRCLAAGQPSRPISVVAPLWSQVVGRAYREDQQRSVSPLNSLSLHLVSLSLPFLFYCPLSFWHYLPPCFPLKSPYFHLHLSLSSLLSPTFPSCCASCMTYQKLFSFIITPPLHENLMRSSKMENSN